jgi:perosamine synthetase
LTNMADLLAIQGGTPVRQTPLPYGRQWVDDDDIAAVVATLRSDWLTTGPGVSTFEQAFASAAGAHEAVAVSSGTAALHAAAYALGIGPGDEVIVPAMTFAATANAVVFQGGTPVFADVDPTTLLLDPHAAEACVTPRTRAIFAVDYAGQPCNYDELRQIAARHGLALLDDACHALGGRYRGRPVGALADLNTFSLHPVKPITAGEGGVITTDDSDMAQRMRHFRNHGITADHQQRQQKGTWFYEMTDLGYNYRLTDIQCALALSQLAKLSGWVARRQELARRYDAAFADLSGAQPLHSLPERTHAYHLYVLRLDTVRLRASRADIFAALRAEGIGVNVHYIPVHLHPFYRQHFGTVPGLCPAAEAAYEEVVSLPIFPRMSDADANDVIAAVYKVLSFYQEI